jgi:hypothetical protein
MFNKSILNPPKKVQQSRNRPGVAQRVSGSLGCQNSWHSAREGGEVVSLTHRRPLPPGMFLVLIFTRGWVDSRAMVRSEGDMSLKNPVTPPGIDPGTVRLVAQRLDHYATSGPSSLCMCVCVCVCVCVYIYIYITFIFKPCYQQSDDIHATHHTSSLLFLSRCCVSVQCGWNPVT